MRRLYEVAFALCGGMLVAFAGYGLINLIYNLGLVITGDATLTDRSGALWLAVAEIAVGIACVVPAFFIAAWIFSNTGPDD